MVTEVRSSARSTNNNHDGGAIKRTMGSETQNIGSCDNCSNGVCNLDNKNKQRMKSRSFVVSMFLFWQQRHLSIRVAIIAALVTCGSYVALHSKLSILPASTSFLKECTNRKVPSIEAKQVPVKTKNPFQCPPKESKGQVSVYNPTKSISVQGFPNTPLISDGFMDQQPDADSILFWARSSKLPNGPILSTGSNFFLNTVQDSYRLLWVKASLNYTSILPTEGVESDVCVTIVPQTKQNSVSSGEEVFCTHEHYFGGDQKSVDPNLIFDFRPGGFPLEPNTKLDVASVSKIFTSKPFAPLDMELVKQRDAPPEPVGPVGGLGMVSTSLDLLALNFEAVIVPSTNEQVKTHVGLRSVRSPLRDRSVFAWPNSEVLPLTEFKNNKSSPVTIHGLGIFRSMLEHYVSGDTIIRVLIDGKLIKEICPAPHRPNATSAPFDAVVDMNVDIPPGSIVRVENRLSSFDPGQTTYRPTPYDLAVYILYEHTDSSSDALVPTGEDALGDWKLDLNNDGFPDYVDYDAYGTIWADLTSPDGAHDTQHGAMVTFMTKKGKFNKPTTKWVWNRDPENKNMLQAKVTDQTENWCFYLRSRTFDHFVFHYCDESAVPYRTLVGDKERLG